MAVAVAAAVIILVADALAGGKSVICNFLMVSIEGWEGRGKRTTEFSQEM